MLVEAFAVSDPFVVREVFPGVREWSVYSPEHKVELTSHAVDGPGGTVVVDPTGAPEDFESVVPSVVVLTSGNHDRAAAVWARRFGCTVWVPRGAGSSVVGARGYGPDETPVDGWSAVPLGGGGPGEMALRVPGLDLVVFGDAVVNLAGRGLQLLPDKYCADPAALRVALRRLVGVPFARAVFAHGAALADGASARIAALL